MVFTRKNLFVIIWKNQITNYVPKTLLNFGPFQVIIYGFIYSIEILFQLFCKYQHFKYRFYQGS